MFHSLTHPHTDSLTHLSISNFYAGEKKVSVDGKIYSGDHVLVAVGGFPTWPKVPGAEHGIDSDGFFELETLPKYLKKKPQFLSVLRALMVSLCRAMMVIIIIIIVVVVVVVVVVIVIVLIMQENGCGWRWLYCCGDGGHPEVARLGRVLGHQEGEGMVEIQIQKRKNNTNLKVVSRC